MTTEQVTALVANVDFATIIVGIVAIGGTIMAYKVSAVGVRKLISFVR